MWEEFTYMHGKYMYHIRLFFRKCMHGYVYMCVCVLIYKLAKVVGSSIHSGNLPIMKGISQMKVRE